MTPSPANILPFEAVVFDFDGTLAELVLDFGLMKRGVAALAAAFLETVPPPNGLPALEYAAHLAEHIHRVSPGAAGRFLAEAAASIRDQELEAARAARLFPETRAVLSRLASRGIRVGIITRNCRAALDLVFPDAARFAGVILARDQARHVKPDPRHLLDALAALGAAPERSLMVGDHPMDLATGQAAGTRTAGVASGRVGLEELAAHGADFVAPDVASLVAML